VDRHLNGEDIGAKVEDDRGSVWTTGWGHWGSLGSDGNAARLTTNGSGLLVGSDVRVNDATALGVVVGQTQTSANAIARDSDAHASATHLGLYARTGWDGFQLNAGLVDAYVTTDAHRNVAIDSFTDALNSHSHANLAQGFVEGSYRFELAQGSSIAPYINLARVRLQQDGYAESGGAAALYEQGGSNALNTGKVGVRGEWMIDAHAGIAAWAALGYQQAWGDLTPAVTERFVAGGDSFEVNGVPLARRSGFANLGLHLPINAHASAEVSYMGQFGGGTKDEGAKLSLNVAF
jgi:fibronectin-binding autotransporter adhesin